MKFAYQIITVSKEEGPFGRIFAKNKSWPKLQEALDELGQDGWDLYMPIYGPFHPKEGSHYCEGFIMKKPLG